MQKCSAIGTKKGNKKMKKTVDEILIIDSPALMNRYNRKERRARKDFKSIIDKAIVFDKPLSDGYSTLETFKQTWNSDFNALDDQVKVELANGEVLKGASVVADPDAITLVLDNNAVTKMINDKITTLYFQLKLAA